jgi:hypothetical protein
MQGPVEGLTCMRLALILFPPVSTRSSLRFVCVVYVLVSCAGGSIKYALRLLCDTTQAQYCTPIVDIDVLYSCIRALPATLVGTLLTPWCNPLHR